MSRAEHEAAMTTRGVPANWGCDGRERSWREPMRWCADRLAAHEGLHDDHRVAAVRAEECRPRRVQRILARLRLLRLHLQQPAWQGQAGAAAAVGQQPVMADAMEAAGEHMQQE
jgi:hypothetical protein